MPQKLLDYWMEASDEALANFVSVAPVLFQAVDENGRIVVASPYWAEFLGYTVDEMIGMPAQSLLEPKAKSKAQMTGPPKTDPVAKHYNIEQSVVKKSGEIASVLASSQSVTDKDGRKTRVLSVFFDNSAAKSAKDALLLKAQEAEEASRAKSVFLAAMSHEIRTPMNAIMGFAQLLKLSSLDERRKRHVDAILNAGGTLMNLLTDLLDLSHIEEGHMRIENRSFDLYELVDEVADWWHAGALNKGLKMIVTLDRSLPRLVHSDPVRIQQVLNNFLGNAVKFTESGSITLRVFQASSDETSSRVRFEVSDTGPGMAPDQIERLFKPFVQIETNFVQSQSGWGLGLSICSNIASQMDGTLGVESTPGEGASFYFEVDLRVDQSPSEPMLTMQDAWSRPLRILLAEDNPSNQDMMRDLLLRLGHEVMVAEDGFQAVEAASREEFDLILMDVMMPGLDGLGAAEQIRTLDGPSNSVPIVACSAQVSDNAQDRYTKAGMDAFLPKPIDAAALSEVIRSLVANPVLER